MPQSLQQQLHRTRSSSLPSAHAGAITASAGIAYTVIIRLATGTRRTHDTRKHSTHYASHTASTAATADGSDNLRAQHTNTDTQLLAYSLHRHHSDHRRQHILSNLQPTLPASPSPFHYQPQPPITTTTYSTTVWPFALQPSGTSPSLIHHFHHHHQQHPQCTHNLHTFHHIHRPCSPPHNHLFLILHHLPSQPTTPHNMCLTQLPPRRRRFRQHTSNSHTIHPAQPQHTIFMPLRPNNISHKMGSYRLPPPQSRSHLHNLHTPHMGQPQQQPSQPDPSQAPTVASVNTHATADSGNQAREPLQRRTGRHSSHKSRSHRRRRRHSRSTNSRRSSRSRSQRRVRRHTRREHHSSSPSFPRSPKSRHRSRATHRPQQAVPLPAGQSFYSLCVQDEAYICRRRGIFRNPERWGAHAGHLWVKALLLVGYNR